VGKAELGRRLKLAPATGRPALLDLMPRLEAGTRSKNAFRALGLRLSISIEHAD